MNTATETKRWHEDDAFWRTFAADLFLPKRWDGTPGEVDQLIPLLELPPGAAVLDLCCGPGRFTLEFARRGFRVTGVDRTAAYLAEARARADAGHLDVTLVQEDMRRFCRFQEFDAVINMFASFGYFEDARDNERVLANVFCSLKPGGVFVLDTMGKEIIARTYQPRDWSEENDRFFLQERTPRDHWSRMENRWVLLDGQKHECRPALRLFSATELAGLLTMCGFDEVKLFGDLAGASYDHQAKRLVAVARKPDVEIGGGI